MIRLPPGARFASYEVVSELGRGGMGVVYEARVVAPSEQAGQRVALKLVTGDLAQDERAAARFDREARTLLAVRHPNVVRVQGVGLEQGVRYLALELVTGGSLASVLRTRGRVPWREAAWIASGVARGLAAVHARGLVHRDLKPENVLMADGTPKLADFGLVRRGGAQSFALTRTGELVGTLLYMAPEQADADAVSDATDLYSLGALLHALVAGQPPFAGEGVELITKHLREPPPRLRRLVADVPEALEKLVLHLLAKDPGDRPGSAEEVAVALERIASAAPGRSRAPAVVALVLVPLAALAAGVAVTSRPRAAPAPPPAVEPFRVTFDPEPLAGVASTASRLDLVVRANRPLVSVQLDRKELLHAPAPVASLTLHGLFGTAATHRVQVRAETGEVVERRYPFDRRLPRSGTTPSGKPTYRHDLPGGAGHLDLVFVPFGNSTIGSDLPRPLAEETDRPAHVATNQNLYVARTELTWRHYLAFCLATLRTPPALLHLSDGTPCGFDLDHPVVNVTWHDAVAFCDWAGLALPTEIEWERAARGTDGRAFPWGNRPSPAEDLERASHYRHPTAGVLAGALTRPVGSFPKGEAECGALDLMGNVAEWCYDAWNPKVYTHPMRERPDPRTAPEHPHRGGCYGLSIDDSRTWRRRSRPADHSSMLIGFRPVRRE